MPSGNGQNGTVRALWEIGCEENSDDHQVVGDRASCRGPVCQIRVREAFNTPRITDLMDALHWQGYVPRLARHEDFGRILEGCGSQLGRKRARTRLEQRHQARREACGRRRQIE